MKLLTLAAASLALIGASAFAQAPAGDPTATPKVDQRQARQQQRIDKGVADGSLTPREAARLQRGQQRVAAAESQAKSDGVVTKKERAGLHHMQDKQSRKIARQKHDAQHRKG